ncbi:MAG: cupin domain-containing protein [Aggregatilineales bacterium]
MPIDENLLEVRDYHGLGYRPLIDYGAWRVAILRYEEAALPQNITKMERHDETDEVFVLLQGRCILFLGAGNEEVTSIVAQNMEPNKLYNVKRAVWHNSTLSEDASVLIVENRDTTLSNSPEVRLTLEHRAHLLRLTEALWSP